MSSTRKVIEPDDRKRVSLGRLARHDLYLAMTDMDGVITLTPVEAIPLPITARRPRRGPHSQRDLLPATLDEEVVPPAMSDPSFEVDVPSDGLCGCGCGYKAPPGNKYVGGHSPRARKPARRCACGCGLPTPAQKTAYYRGHRPRGRDPEEFWSRTERDGSGCRPWKEGKTNKGYGVVAWEGKTWATHRLAWTLTHGPIPDGKWVLHHCDNPPCCNAGEPGRPEVGCLYLGDHEKNVADKVERGRQVDGPRHGRAKLTTEQIEEIRRRYIPSSGGGRSDGNKDQLAAEFGVHPKYVYWIWKNRYRKRA